MITAERLEELMKQGATIWYGRNRWGCPIKLDTKHFVIVNGTLRYHKNKMLIGDGYESKDLREDVDRGKWEKQMFISRTERFEPPMWEDLPIKWDFYFVKDKYMFHFGYENYNGDKRVIVSKCEYACEYGSDGYHVIYEKFGNATKENYIKACEIVRDLFNRGNK